jgi:hypothetical protein
MVLTIILKIRICKGKMRITEFVRGKASNAGFKGVG